MTRAFALPWRQTIALSMRLAAKNAQGGCQLRSIWKGAGWLGGALTQRSRTLFAQPLRMRRSPRTMFATNHCGRCSHHNPAIFRTPSVCTRVCLWLLSHLIKQRQHIASQASHTPSCARTGQENQLRHHADTIREAPNVCHTLFAMADVVRIIGGTHAC